ncbi:MAG: tRNA preQ1(34) S-adenosylmethionine ribosyltransferase-isomerase QueA [bacterium]|nr:tRNA preQ1(34) S-adenosylmethionine ribosyltransferase-isomerase QueA [bacterium]
MKLSDFDYNLNENLIAQMPSQKRDNSRMMHLIRSTKSIEHKHFYDIVDILTPNDFLVLNNTKVIPARIFGKKQTGANIEIFLLKEIEPKVWEVLLKPAKRVKVGDTLDCSEKLFATLLEKDDETCKMKLDYDGNIYAVLDEIGQMPLPPYIERRMSSDDIKKLDYERYQTVFAKNEGSVAAPTAGLHFTKEILKKLAEKGVGIAELTLTVGLGTFRPVKCENILEHKMHSEEFSISKETSDAINSAKKAGKNIVAVGTTSVRTLETVMQKYGEVKECQDHSELFIYPGYEFKIVDKILTNFHLPKSTLLMLVSAFAGKDFIFEAYNQALKEEYRFFSYGDCMLIE